MKNFHSLFKQVEKWRQKHHLGSKLATKTAPVVITNINHKPVNKAQAKGWQQTHSPLMFTFAILSLTSVVGYRYYSQPELDVGTIAPETIVAPWDASFEDKETTEALRREKRNGVIPVLKRDEELSADIKFNLTEYLAKIENLRNSAGKLPFVDENILPLTTQRYLRQCEDWQWETILARVEYTFEVNPHDNGFWSSGSSYREVTQQIKQISQQLQEYRQKVSKSEYQSLIANIELARNQYARAWEDFQVEETTILDKTDKITLLEVSDEVWEETKTALLRATEKILTQGIARGIPDNIKENAVQSQLNDLIPIETESLSSELLAQILQPNLIENKEETQRMAKQAEEEVETQIASRKQGEIIVEEGNEITQEQFVLLEGYGLMNRVVNWEGIAGSVLFVSATVLLFLLLQRRVFRSYRYRDQLLIYLLTLSSPLLVIFNPAYINLPAIALLTSSMYNPVLAITQVTLTSGLVIFATEAAGWEYILASLAGGIVAANIGKRRCREELAILGLGVGVTQGVAYLIFSLITSATAGVIWFAVLPGAITYGLLGVAWSVMALGLSPYLEKIFDIVTPTRLAELSNPNRPLLRLLAEKTPGTYQHTLFVSSLAEAAGRKLNCNVELIRAGALYHDIGKMHDPQGFIENQMGKPNKHDQINDPWKSAEIIKKHVSEGLVMAKQHNLPKAIRDFIPQHQGTLFISYFYFQAKNKAEKEGGRPVLEEDFRYDGPIPQSREAGILMLADACEAALRSLKDVSQKEALSMIQKIFKARWQDNQLVDSGLSYEELPIIADVFVKVWQDYNHQRIIYPKN